MNKRVLILVNHNVVIYNFRKELVKRLVADGYEVFLSCPEGNRIAELKEMGCRHIPVEFDRHGTNPIKELGLIKYYKSIMKEVMPFVVLSYTIKPNLYGGMAAAAMGIPYLANITGLGTAVENEGIMQKITLMMYRYAFRRINRIYVQNEENKQFFMDRKIKPDKLYLLPGSGVNLDEFQPIDYPDDKNVNFVFISRIMKEKGVEQYLAAAEYIRGKYPETSFHICGFCEDAYEDRLKELQDKGIIIYHGMVSNVREVIKDCHCTIHPTYYPEGMSNVLLESCACARPIITTDRSGCREVVDNGKNGYIIKPKDSRDLIEKIESFLSLPHEEKKQMGLAGRRKVEKEFDRQIVVDAYMNDIHEIEGITNVKKQNSRISYSNV